MTRLELLKLDYTLNSTTPTSSPRQHAVGGSRSKCPQESDLCLKTLLTSSPFTHRLDLRVFGNVAVLNGYVGAPLVGLQEISSSEIIQALELMQVSVTLNIVLCHLRYIGMCFDLILSIMYFRYATSYILYIPVSYVRMADQYTSIYS